MYRSKYSNDYQVMTEGYVMNGDFRQHPYSIYVGGQQWIWWCHILELLWVI